MTTEELRQRLRFKHNVNPAGAHPMLQSFIVNAVEVFWRVAGAETVVTSMCDGVHGWNSFHYLLMAVDLRSKHLDQEEKDAVLRALRDEAGPGWDIILEAQNTTNEHFHIEWDRGREHASSYLRQLQQEFTDRLVGDLD